MEVMELIIISVVFLGLFWVLITKCKGATIEEIDEYCKHLEGYKHEQRY